MTIYKSFKERWEWLLSFAVFDDPFTATMLTMLNDEESKRVKTMAVYVDGLDMRLLYNRKFVEALPDEAVRYVLAHEMVHLALHHCTTRMPTEEEQLKKHKIAADLEVNSLLVETAHCKMPAPPFTPLLAAQYGLPDKLSLEQYFAMLPDAPQQDDGDGNEKGEGSQSGQGGKGDGDEEGDDSQDGGKGEGDEEGDEKQDGDGGKGEGDEEGDEELQPLEDGGFDEHDKWSGEDNMIADDVIRQKIAEMANSERCWGNMPADVKQIILEAQKSRVSWDKLLRVMLGHLPGKTFTHTFKRPNRRFGWPYSGFKRDYIDRVLVLWDTSGSIHNTELSKFLSEVNRIAESRPVDVQMFDFGLQGKLIPFNRKMKSIEVIGRGGTSFKEPFELADKLRYSSVVCLTDGQARPIEKPRHVRQIIWAIVGEGNKPPVDWGKVINIDTVNGLHLKKAA